MTEPNEAPHPIEVPAAGRMRSTWLPIAFFFLIAALVIWGTALIVEPYVISILVAAVLVTFTYPWYEKIRGLVGGRENLASILTLLLLTVVVIVPAFLLSMALVRQATQLFEVFQGADVRRAIEELRLDARVSEALAMVPGIDAMEIDLGGVLYGALKGIPGWVAAQGGNIVGGLLSGVMRFFLALVAAFYLFVDGKKLIDNLMDLSPFPREYDQRILSKIKGVINANFVGQGLTSLAQGVATGVGLAIVGIPGALFWGAVAAVLSLIPLVGAAVVWVPAVGYLFWTGGIGWKAIFLLAWGAGVVSTIDNLVRPLAMKSGAEMPGVVLLFAILGGMSAFGFFGILLGPLVIALLVSILGIYRELFRDSLKPQAPTEQRGTG
jgi:predicted PurR-regulated permease PerM